MVAIKKQLVSNNVINKRSFGRGNPCKYITIHETDNPNKGAHAQAHANLQSRLNPRKASWHYQVDDKEIIQSFPENVQCWAGGDGRGNGNTNSIHIEVCVNSDGDFKKAVRNAAELTKVLMARHNIPIARVVQHNKWSGKNCPRNLRSGAKGIDWSNFIAMVKGSEIIETKVKGTSNKPATVAKPSKSKSNLTVDGKWGTATTGELQKALGTSVDGVISSQPQNSVTKAIYSGITWGNNGSPMVRALQRKIGAKADGKLGPETVRKLQQYLGTPVDGVISRPTSVMVKELQRRLNKGNF